MAPLPTATVFQIVYMFEIKKKKHIKRMILHIKYSELFCITMKKMVYKAFNTLISKTYDATANDTIS